MKSNAKTVEEYLEEVPEERKGAFNKLRETILMNLPKGFKEEMSYGMIGYVVPHEIYPAGYHVSPDLSLPFISIASQKNFIGFYHLGIYTMPELLRWFEEEYPKHSEKKLDMGKSCVRLNKLDQIPYELIGELVKKVSVEEWIKMYETHVKK